MGSPPPQATKTAAEMANKGALAQRSVRMCVSPSTQAHADHFSGYWVPMNTLKTKALDRLGDADRVQQSRERAKNSAVRAVWGD